MASITVPLLLLLGATTPHTAAQETAAVDSRVESELMRAPETEVFVLLHEPRLPRRAGRAVRRRALAADRAAVLRKMPVDGVRMDHELSLVSGFSARINAAGLAALRRHPSVRRIDAMAYGRAALSDSVPLIRADAVQRRHGRGGGVTVAVLDTGVDPAHPDLAGRIVAEECFCRPLCCPDGTARQSGAGSARTGTAHGPHVTGILASQGMIAPVGVAPDVDVVAVKVLDERQLGLLVDWIAALDWIAMHRPDVQLVNMSLVSADLHEGFCDDVNAFSIAFAQVFEALRSADVLAFAASGNLGQRQLIGMPACVSEAVAVGAVTKDDRVWLGSNSSSAIDLLAPGVSISSVGTGASTMTITGTSMAVPHVAGSAALLLALDPGMTADRLERLLKETGVPIADPRNEQITPRVDALAAYRALSDAVPPVLGGGARRNDCLAVWNVDGAWGRTGGEGRLTCDDGDESCDGDNESGQCTFTLSACFNAADPRLPACAGADVRSHVLVQPSPESSDVLDAANGRALRDAIGPLQPVGPSSACSEPFALVVPAGQRRTIRFATLAEDGRRDTDRLDLGCSTNTESVNGE